MGEAIPYLTFFMNLFKNVYDVSKQQPPRNKEFIDAVFKIDKASNRTLNYLAKKEYEPSAELTDLWIDAARAIYPFDRNLSEMLVNKSDFWADPGRWVNLGVADTIVTLKELKEITEVYRQHGKRI